MNNENDKSDCPVCYEKNTGIVLHREDKLEDVMFYNCGCSVHRFHNGMLKYITNDGIVQYPYSN